MIVQFRLIKLSQIENESLKETMQWGNKGQIDGATYNWHKRNDAFKQLRTNP